jgi:Cu(I)/Ag(I) efflux system membrane fusion protein
VTSAQFLIDSEASLAGSVKRLQAVNAIPVDQGPGPIFASGWVDEVNPAERRVRISHGPIEALGWPSMTMVFDARPGVDLSGIEAGQSIRFSLEQEHAGEYVLANVFSGENGTGELADMEGGVFPDSAPATPAEPAGESRRIKAAAIVRGVMPAERALKLEHDAIPELDWPAMTMTFRVSESVSLDPLEAGQSIHFSMVEEDGVWVIDQVHVMSTPASNEGQDHD